jgi:hypothetical protein
MARGGARSIRQALLALLVICGVGGFAYVAWSQRPIPSYASEDVTSGSPFDVTFRVENKNASFALANLKVSCVLDHVRASGMEPTLIAANDLRFPPGSSSGLEPGQSATFTCPFRSLIGHPINEDPGIAQRSEIYFRAEYDLPLPAVLRLFRITDNSAPFFLNTRLLPPRWTAKPPGKP